MTSDYPALRRAAALASTAVLCLTAACAARPVSSPPPSSAALWQQVLAEVGSAACSNDAQCHGLAIGHKACGGPASFLAWSSQVSREPVLRQRADDYSQAQQAASAARGRVSTCSVLTDPGAHCDAASQRCVLNGAAPAWPASAQ